MAHWGIDLDKLRARTLGNTALMNELLDLFGVEAAAALTRLSRAALAEDLPAAKAATHRFKSSAATIGAIELARLLADAETAAAAGESIVDRLPAIDAETARCINEAAAVLR